MAHYYTHNLKESFKEEAKDLTQDDLDYFKEQGQFLLEALMDGTLKKVTASNAVREKDSTFGARPPSDITLYDPSGLATKIYDNVLYAGVNGDWVNLSLGLDLLGVDWKRHLDVEI